MPSYPSPSLKKTGSKQATMSTSPQLKETYSHNGGGGRSAGRFHKDLEIAGCMITEEYLAKHIRKRPMYTNLPCRPPLPESPFGPFPSDFKRKDSFDGNVHDRLARVKPSRLPRETLKDRQRVIRPSSASPSSTNATSSFIRLDGKGVMAAKLLSQHRNNQSASASLATKGQQKEQQTRPRTAHPTSSFSNRNSNSNDTYSRSSINDTSCKTTTTNSNRKSRSNSNNSYSRNSSSSTTTSTTGTRRPQTASNDAASRSGYLPTTTASINKTYTANAYQDVQQYMKHQGKFARPASQVLSDFVGRRFRHSVHQHIHHHLPPKAPVAGAYRVRPMQATLFRAYYDRADLPCSILHRAGSNRLKWHVPPQNLDYHAYLPLFFEGLCEINDPYRFMAMQGIVDLVQVCPSKLLACIPQVILPLKKALDTHEPYVMSSAMKVGQVILPFKKALLDTHEPYVMSIAMKVILLLLRKALLDTHEPYVMSSAMKVLQHLVQADREIGLALVPYYRQLLPALNLFKHINDNRGDGIDYNQRRRLCVGDLIAETLELLEITGGVDAFINIKYMVPSYESSRALEA